MAWAVIPAIPINEVLLYLGYRGGDLPASMERDIAAASDELRACARPRLRLRRFALSDSTPVGTTFRMTGNDIAAHLTDCHEVVLMAATLGPDVERRLMRAEVTDMAHALILDACASAAIEALCDEQEADLRRQLEEEGLYLTDRYSPGYGDFPIAAQRDFCRVLDTGRSMGLAVSDSGILIPRKSVTAVMGISRTPRPRRSRGCQHCNLFRTCQFRKDGEHCGH